jgi:hypothetical protein
MSKLLKTPFHHLLRAIEHAENSAVARLWNLLIGILSKIEVC